MKRYNPKIFKEDPVTKEISMFDDYRVATPYLGEDHIRVTMIEEPDGLWVKWEDVKTKIVLIRTLKEEINRLKTITGTGAESPKGIIIKGEALKVEEMKCNCEEMFEAVKYLWADGSDANWFCPAHGYKKR